MNCEINENTCKAGFENFSEKRSVTHPVSSLPNPLSIPQTPYESADIRTWPDRDRYIHNFVRYGAHPVENCPCSMCREAMRKLSSKGTIMSNSDENTVLLFHGSVCIVRDSDTKENYFYTDNNPDAFIDAVFRTSAISDEVERLLSKKDESFKEVLAQRDEDIRGYRRDLRIMHDRYGTLLAFAICISVIAATSIALLIRMH